MKRLLEMIDQVKLQKVIFVLGGAPEGAKSDRSEPVELIDTKVFWDSVDKCHPFVFSPKNKEPEEIDMLEIKKLHEDENYQPPRVDSPFRVWSAEIAGDKYITVPKVRDSEDKFFICSFMAVELNPSNLIYFVLAEWSDVLIDEQGNEVRKDFKQVYVTGAMDDIANALLQRLYREKTGIEKTRRKVKIGEGKSKRHVTFNQVIHIMPKKDVSPEITSEDGKSIDWSHRWTVRGCWVNLGDGRIGKDREGNYCVDGKTWRVEHIKGPEDAPLIQKTRIVMGE